MHLFLIIKISPTILRAMTHSVNSHTCSCLDLGEEGFRSFQDMFPVLLQHRGRQPPNQGQPGGVCFSSNFKGQPRESSS